MSFLINRAPAARFKCLHNIMQLAVNKFSLSDSFNLTDLMYDAQKINIYNFCDLLINDTSLNLKYCPYLKNPLSDAGCNLTNGVYYDSTKRKEVSNTANSLDALGFLKREDRDLRITELGLKFAKTKYESRDMHKIIKKAVLNYGLCIGVLYQIKELNKTEFTKNEVYVGYPFTNEKILVNNQNITVSSGSQPDANTRTKSCILAWLTTAGFIIPKQYYSDKIKPEYTHIDTMKYNLSKIRNLQNHIVFDFPNYIFQKREKFIVNNPFDYDNFTKNTGALRENGQKASREITMRYEQHIKNRRLAIVYLLNKAYLNSKKIDYKKLIIFLKSKPDYFVISERDFKRVMSVELQFANNCGIPYKILQGMVIEPITGINSIALCKNAPTQVIEYLNTFEGFI